MDKNIARIVGCQDIIIGDVRLCYGKSPLSVEAFINQFENVEIPYESLNQTIDRFERLAEPLQEDFDDKDYL